VTQFPERKIKLHNGQFAIVDGADFDAIVRLSRVWTAIDSNGKTYAAFISKSDGKTKTDYMHRVLMNAPSELTVDHINGNSLDNRRQNLRLATRAQNMQNAGANSRNTSGYKGVHWLAAASKWQARIRHNGKRIHLGVFDTAEQADEAYRNAADSLHGEFANTRSANSRLEKAIS